jgi:hypothetical protein
MEIRNRSENSFSNFLNYLPSPGKLKVLAGAGIAFIATYYGSRSTPSIIGKELTVNPHCSFSEEAQLIWNRMLFLTEPHTSPECSFLKQYGVLFEKIESTDLSIKEAALAEISFKFEKLSSLIPTESLDLSIKAISRLTQSDHSDIQIAGLELFRKFVEKDQGFQLAIEAASKAAQSHHSGIQIAGLELFEKLVEKDRGFEQAIEAASKAAQSDTFHVQTAGFELFKKLIEKDQGFKQAIEASSKAIQSNDSGIQIGLELFTKLVQKKQGFEQTIETASKALKGRFFMLKHQASNFLESSLKRSEPLKKLKIIV